MSKWDIVTAKDVARQALQTSAKKGAGQSTTAEGRPEWNPP
jgi:hypothetical protein